MQPSIIAIISQKLFYKKQRAADNFAYKILCVSKISFLTTKLIILTSRKLTPGVIIILRSNFISSQTIFFKRDILDNNNYYSHVKQ